MRKELTDIVVRNTRPPAEVWDLALSGFGLRVTEKGARSYFIMYRIGEGEARRQRRMTIGDARLIGLGDARQRARKALQAVKDGIDPMVKVVPPERLTVKAVFERYMAEKEFRPRTAAFLRAGFERDVIPVWGARPIDEVTKADVVQIVAAKKRNGAPVGANRLHSTLRAFFGWAIKNAILTDSPCVGTAKVTKEIPRERTLDEGEIRLFWEATRTIGGSFGDLFQLLLVTAQRRDEVREAHWREFNLDTRTWTIPAERVKNGKKHEVALSDLAVAILERRPRGRGADLVFASARGRGGTAVSGLSRAKRRLDKAMSPETGIERFTLHDLRRTAATQMAELGIAPQVVDKILNHTAGTIRGVAAIYNRHEYAPQQRDALNRWGERLARIVGVGEDAEVVTLRARA